MAEVQAIPPASITGRVGKLLVGAIQVWYSVECIRLFEVMTHPSLKSGIWLFVLRRVFARSGGIGGNLMAVGKSKAKIYVEENLRTTFGGGGLGPVRYTVGIERGHVAPGRHDLRAPPRRLESPARRRDGSPRLRDAGDSLLPDADARWCARSRALSLSRVLDADRSLGSEAAGRCYLSGPLLH